MSGELGSPLVYIHPPLAIAGYAFTFLLAFFLFRKTSNPRKTQILGAAAWALTFAGLATGMLWAQLAWGSYWSWDPKETLTLVLFVSTSASVIAHFEKKAQTAKWLCASACVMALVTGTSSFIMTGLHSFLH